MIQNFIINIKSLFNKNQINFLNPLTLDEFQTLESHCLNNLSKSTTHSHKGKTCKSPNMEYFLSYQRNYIYYHNNECVEKVCEIPVVYCNSCKHFHAILPNYCIVPYCQYSIFFILCVLYDKKYNNLIIEDIADKYNISISTIYRWEKKYMYFFSIYKRLRNRYHMNLFIGLLSHYEEIIIEIFDLCGQSLFQHNRNLNSPPPPNTSSSSPPK